MEIEEVMSDLLALRQLYGLLQNIGYGFRNKSSENLDEHARLLLKNLLDNATERFFETHSKIIAAQSGVSKTPFPFEPPKAARKSNSPVLPDKLKAFPSITRNSSVDSKCQTVTSQKDERLPKKPTFEGAASELYSSNKPEYRKKRCRNCGRRRMKPRKTSPNKGGNPLDGERRNQSSPFDGDNRQAKGSPDVEVKSVESVPRSNENPFGQPKTAHQLQSCHRSMVNNSSSHLASGEIETGVEVASQTGKMPDEASDFSEDVTNAVKCIESRISALQQYCSQTVESTKTCAAWGGIPNSETPLMLSLSKEGLATRSELSYGGEKVVLGRQATGVGRKYDTILSPAQQLWLLRQNTKPIESPSRSDDATNQIGGYVHGFGVPTTLSRDDYLSKMPPSLAMSPPTMNADRGSTTLSPAQQLQLLRQKTKPIESPSRSDDSTSQIGELSYGGKKVVLGRQATGVGRKYNTILSPAQQLRLLRQNTKPIESPSRSDDATSQIGDYVHGFGVPTTLSRDDYLPKMPPSLAMSPPTMNADRGSTTWSPAQQLQLLRQKTKPIESPSRSDDSTSQIGDYVQGFEVPTTHGRDDYLPKRPPSPLMSPMTMKADRPRPSKALQRVEPTGSSVGRGGQTQRPISRRQIREKQLPHRMAIKPTLLDHESSETKQAYRDRRRGTHHKMTHEGPQREIPPPWDEESHDSSASYLSSSSSSSSLPSQIRSSDLSSSPSYSSLPSQMRAHHRIGLTSARMTSGSRSEESSSELEESDSESESGISVPRTHSRDADPPRRIGPSRTYRSDRRRNSGNAMGRFRRFKNKLGLIFHHHHHHHHHHHQDDRGHSQADHHNQSLWKSSQKMFQRSNLHDVRHDPMVQKVKRTKVNNVPSKHQVGHFHALVEGLLRHVQHSKRSKPPRGGMVGLGDNIGTRGGKNGGKKLRWWKMFRRHGGVKIPKRRRVRGVGYLKKKKKPLLKMS